MLKSICLGLAIVLGLAGAANGVFMLFSPYGWYTTVPGVMADGLFNQHFVRDIGLIFLLIGAGLLIGAANAGWRSLLWLAATTWLTGHALFHVWEVCVGIRGPEALLRDFGAVSLPAIVSWILVAWSLREDRRAAGGAIQNAPSPSS